jgi:hypothetical protein
MIKMLSILSSLKNSIKSNQIKFLQNKLIKKIKKILN